MPRQRDNETTRQRDKKQLYPKWINILLLWIAILSAGDVSAQVTMVGTDVGIPDLASAQSQGLLLPNIWGSIDQPFTVDGDFLVEGTHTFYSAISVEGHLMFKNADINCVFTTIKRSGGNGATVSFEDADVRFTISVLSDLDQLSVLGACAINVINSEIEDVFAFSTLGQTTASINLSHSIVDNTNIRFRSSGELRVEKTTLRNLGNPVVILEGNYIGRDNSWLNNNADIAFGSTGSFRKFQEINSIFRSNKTGGAHVFVRNSWDVDIIDCSFTSNQDWAVQVDLAMGFVIVRDCEIINLVNGIGLTNSSGNYLAIQDVTLRNMNSRGVGVTIINNTTEPLVERLDIDNCDLEYGIFGFSNTRGMSVKSCTINGCDYGYYNGNTNGSITFNNYFDGANFTGMWNSNANFQFHECNNFYNSPVGFELSGNAIGLSFLGNHFENNVVGLQYDDDGAAVPQIEAGNTFEKKAGTYDARMLGFGGPNKIGMNRYITNVNVPEEQAINNQTDWFRPLGDDSWICDNGSGGGGLVSTNNKIDHIKYLFACLDTSATDCYCYLNQKAALMIIEEDPDVLLDSYVDSIYQTLNGAPVNALPHVSDMLASINGTGSVEFDTIVIGADTSFQNPQLTTILNIEKDQEVAYYVELRAAKMDSVQNALAGISIGETEVCALSEREMLSHYLDALEGDSLTDSETIEVIATAESCISDKGEGVYLAQGLAYLFGIGFTPSNNCSVMSRSANSIEKQEVAEIILTPNPTAGHLAIDGLADGNYYAYNQLGQPYSVHVRHGVTDVSLLPAGIYILLDEKSGRSGRFIKID